MHLLMRFLQARFPLVLSFVLFHENQLKFAVRRVQGWLEADNKHMLIVEPIDIPFRLRVCRRRYRPVLEVRHNVKEARVRGGKQGVEWQR